MAADGSMEPSIDDIAMELESFLSDRPNATGPASGTSLAAAPVSASSSAFHPQPEVDVGRIDGVLEPTSFANIAAATVGRSYHEMAAPPARTSSNGMAPTPSPTSDLMSSEPARFLSNAHPWRNFFLPISLPASNGTLPRFRDNLFHYQTNYAIVFLACLIIEILLHPSALVSIVCTIAFWVVFMKKNSDPDWNPKVGNFQPGPSQRLLMCAVITAVVLVSTAGSTVSGTALFFLSFVIGHGFLHDPVAVSSMGMDGMHVPL